MKRPALLVFSAFLLALAGAAVYLLYDYHRSSASLERIEISSFAGTDALTGLPMDIPVDDRLTLVNFWSPWCVLCVAELPVLDKARSRMAVVGVMRPPVKKGVLETFKIGYPNIIGDDELFERYRVSAIPSTYVIKGRHIVETLPGVVSDRDIDRIFSAQGP